MPITVTCSCGSSYDLRDEFASRTLRCPKCGGTIQAPAADAIPIIEGDPAFARDKFLLRQKAVAINEKYYVWDEQGQNILFIERPAHLGRTLLALFAGIVTAAVVGVALGVPSSMLPSEELRVAGGIATAVIAIAALLAVVIVIFPKRHMTIYRDDTRQERLLEIIQVNKVQLINAHFEVRDTGGQVLAKARKNYLYNLIRRRWHVMNPDGSMLCLAMEDSIVLSLLRRLLGPMFGLLRTNFIIVEPGTDNIIGEFNRKFTLLDRYVLDMSADTAHQIDRRIALALGALLDTGEKR